MTSPLGAKLECTAAKAAVQKREIAIAYTLAPGGNKGRFLPLQQ
jgi:hypothetical protein